MDAPVDREQHVRARADDVRAVPLALHARAVIAAKGLRRREAL
jgi:hypothetical protein